MKRLLLSALVLSACAPATTDRQPVQVYEGTGRVLLREQRYRLTFTVGARTHDLGGVLENLTSGDRFEAQGTFLPVREGAELTARLTVGDGPALNVSVLGLGVSGLSAKADAFLSGRVVGGTFTGTLRVNKVPYPVTLRRVQ